MWYRNPLPRRRFWVWFPYFLSRLIDLAARTRDRDILHTESPWSAYVETPHAAGQSVSRHRVGRTEVGRCLLLMNKDTPKCCFSNFEVALTEEAAIAMCRHVQMKAQIRAQLRCHPYQASMSVTLPIRRRYRVYAWMIPTTVKPTPCIPSGCCFRCTHDHQGLNRCNRWTVHLDIQQSFCPCGKELRGRLREIEVLADGETCTDSTTEQVRMFHHPISPQEIDLHGIVQCFRVVGCAPVISQPLFLLFEEHVFVYDVDGWVFPGEV